MNAVPDADATLRRALTALERSRAKLEAMQQERSEPIAIIGAGCRLPGGIRGMDAYWALLARGGDAVSELPEARWHTNALCDSRRSQPGKVYSNAMAVLDEADRFDAAFFGIGLREAERMDPQQRLLLEVAVEAIEQAGLDLDQLRGTDTGAFIGICANDFGHRFPIESLDTYSATGRALATASGRLSYTFGLQGPAISIDTACSSSLVAVHLACHSLRKRETGLVLVGGVHVTAGAETAVGMAKLNSLSPSGRCRAFSADADGYVRGEGCVVLVLKRLSDAQRDSDAILATIRASAVNQDGRSNGLTAPSGAAQTALLRTCLSASGLHARDIGYLEAHGTGTELGDPIELGAIAAAYGTDRGPNETLWVGSGKTNVGHLEAAAGIAGLLRAVLALRQATIPPNLHFKAPNPHFDWRRASLDVPTEPTAFRLNDGGTRIAGVSSFGFSGTNAHILLEQSPRHEGEGAPVHDESGEPIEPLMISAASEAALHSRCLQLAQGLQSGRFSARELCRATRGRSPAHAERLALIGTDGAHLVECLQAYARGEAVEGCYRGTRQPGGAGVVAVFSGQGRHWEGMARDLYARDQGTFRRTFDTCEAAISAHGGPSIGRALLASNWSEAGFPSDVMQPLLFAIAVALAEHLRQLGVRWSAVVGQSLGEIAAAVVAGALSLEEGARIAVLRGRLTLSAAGGAMAMIELSLSELEQAIRDTQMAVTVAASNGPTSSLVSGEASAVQAFTQRLSERGIYCRMARVSYASHSAFMDPLLAPLKAGLQDLHPRDGEIPIYSTVTGQRVAGTSLTADYWAANLRQAVMLYPAVQSLIGAGYRAFLELAPKPLLSASIEEALRFAKVAGCVVPAMLDDEPAVRTAARAVARLYAQGADVRLPRTSVDIELPAYPWAHTLFALPAGTPLRADRPAHNDLLGPPIAITGQPGTWIFEGWLRPDQPIVMAHQVQGEAVLPGAAYLQMAYEAGRQLWPDQDVALADVQFERVLAFGPGQPGAQRLQLLLEEDRGGARWRLSSYEPGQAARWVEHARGCLRVGVPLSAPLKDDASFAQETRARMPNTVSADAFYADLAASGLVYGAPLQNVEQFWCDDSTFIAQLKGTSAQQDHAVADAFVLDACLHGLAWLAQRNAGETLLPVSLSGLVFAANAAAPVWVRGTRRMHVDAALRETSCADLVVWDADGAVVAQWSGLQARGAASGPNSLLGASRYLYAQAWEEQAIDEQVKPARAWLIVAADCALPPAVLESARLRLHAAPVVSWARADGRAVLQERLRVWRTDSTGAECERSLLYLSSSVGAAGGHEAVDIDACLGALDLVQAALSVFGEDERPQLCFVTQGAQRVEALGLAARASLGDAGLWGFARSLSLEHPELRGRCIDLPPSDVASCLDRLVQEVSCASAETEVALRSSRWVARLRRSPLPPEKEARAARSAEAYRLEIDTPGVLGSLTWREMPLETLASGEVEIEVEAAALNFADIMRAMGFFRTSQERLLTLGSECAGVISRLGPDVKGLRLGQRVVAVGEHGFASRVKARASCVAHIPAGMAAETAAALPIASMTAWYALIEVAAVRPGHRVLIHTATGGTGLALVQLALARGAQVFATAGSPAKRQLLRERGLHHVFDSRSDAFEHGVLEATGGEGVDVVLNTLSGKGIEQSLRVLAPDGWFLELGKRDIHEDGRLPLRYFKKRLRYVAIDLAGMQRERAQRFDALFQRVIAAVADKEISPLPTTVTRVDQACEAFQQMASAQHVGKLVLSFCHANVPIGQASGPGPRVRGKQLITGGWGALGLALAEWLVDQGARHLVLAGRLAPTAQATARIEGLRARGVAVDLVFVDLASHSALLAQWPRIRDGGEPLRGIFHLAGILRDGLLDGQTAVNFRAVLAPKAQGAWHLHCLSLNAELDHFVLYSSAASLLPAAAQANYAAANAFLDALADHRQALGLPALSVQWGPFSEVGLAAMQDRGARLAARGTASMTVQEAHHYLGMLMKRQAASVGVFTLEGARWLAANPPIAAVPRFEALRSGGCHAAAQPVALNQLTALPPAQRMVALRALVARHAAAVLRVTEAAALAAATLQQIGMDSLSGLELRNRLEGEVGLRLSSTLFWRYPTVEALADYLSRQLALAVPGEVSTAAPHERVASSDSKTGVEHWFLVPRRLDAPRMRLLCVPFMGGLASVFSNWPQYLPPDIEVQALQLPGRPPRQKELAFNDFDTLVDALREVIAIRLDRPYALYGHSLGALVCFGLTHALKEANLPLPRHLFLGAYPAPHLHNPLRDISELSESAFIDALTRLRGIPEQILNDHELLALFLPSLRADLQLLKSYHHVPRAPLQVPTTALYATQDHLVDVESVAAWREHVGTDFQLERIAGGHFFVRDALQVVVDKVGAQLAHAG